MADDAGAPIRVLIVDDSATVRTMLTHRLAADPRISVVGTAPDGLRGLELIEELCPDVVTMDFEMPRLDGLRTLERLMSVRPTPVIMVSSHTTQGAALTMRALELGAVDFVTKPASRVVGSGSTIEELIAKVHAAAGARLPVPGRPADASAPSGSRSSTWLPRAVVIGASTGGPQALATVLGSLSPALRVAIVVVQHMPPGFTRSLAERLDRLCPLPVREAAEGDRFERGLVLVAPGGAHLRFDGEGRVRLDPDGDPECGVRPAVNVTMESVVALRGSRTLGIVLTGMGVDGMRGAGLIKRAGGEVIAQDEETALIYGMPRAVVEAGHADEVVPLEWVAHALEARCAASSRLRSA